MIQTSDLHVLANNMPQSDVATLSFCSKQFHANCVLYCVGRIVANIADRLSLPHVACSQCSNTNSVFAIWRQTIGVLAHYWIGMHNARARSQSTVNRRDDVGRATRQRRPLTSRRVSTNRLFHYVHNNTSDTRLSSCCVLCTLQQLAFHFKTFSLQIISLTPSKMTT